jgi:hypothetical protein
MDFVDFWNRQQVGFADPHKRVIGRHARAFGEDAEDPHDHTSTSGAGIWLNHTTIERSPKGTTTLGQS